MYLYYEHHKDANGKVVLTQLRLSSWQTGKLEIAFYQPLEKIVFESLKGALKWPPISAYSYDPKLYIWSYFGSYGVSSSYGEEVIKKIEAIVTALGQPFKAFAVSDLESQITAYNRVDLNAKPKMSAEEFFYNHGQPAASPELTKDQITAKFRELTGFTYLDKKSYRQAASIFHPDRIGGNAKKMSEINMLWQMYSRMETVTV